MRNDETVLNNLSLTVLIEDVSSLSDINNEDANPYEKLS